MKPQSLADRAKAIAEKARSYADAKGTTKHEPPPAADEPKASSSPARDWWRVYSPDGAGEWPIVVDVLVRPAQTFHEMRTLYSKATGVIPREHADL